MSVISQRAAGELAGGSDRGDRMFEGLATVMAASVPLLLVAIVLLLLVDAMPALQRFGGTFLTDTVWDPVNEHFGAAAYVYGTVVTSLIGLLIAAPIGVGCALFVAEYAPRWMRAPVSFLIELLAAIPSIIYGLWGIFVLGPAAVPAMKWLEEKLGFIPIFEGPASATGRTMLVAGLVLAVMILPIVSAIAREAFSQTPRKLQEGAQALGATRWEMIRMTVLPFGKSSVISGAMLGLGRALGETMAVTIILSVSGAVTFNLISQANPSTIAANIALNFPDSSGIKINALIATGLVLFAITLVTNFIARAIISRSNVQ
jgi:phosphate transport system permease protein